MPRFNYTTSSWFRGIGHGHQGCQVLWTSAEKWIISFYHKSSIHDISWQRTIKSSSHCQLRLSIICNPTVDPIPTRSYLPTANYDCQKLQQSRSVYFLVSHGNIPLNLYHTANYNCQQFFQSHSRSRKIKKHSKMFALPTYCQLRLSKTATIPQCQLSGFTWYP